LKLWRDEPLTQIVQAFQIQQFNIDRIAEKHAHPTLRFPLQQRPSILRRLKTPVMVRSQNAGHTPRLLDTAVGLHRFHRDCHPTGLPVLKLHV